MVEKMDIRPEEEVERTINTEYISKFGDSEGVAPLQVTSIPHKALYRITRMVSSKFILIPAEDINECIDGKGSRTIIKALKKLRKL